MLTDYWQNLSEKSEYHAEIQSSFNFISFLSVKSSSIGVKISQVRRRMSRTRKDKFASNDLRKFMSETMILANGRSNRIEYW